MIQPTLHSRSIACIAISFSNQESAAVSCSVVHCRATSLDQSRERSAVSTENGMNSKDLGKASINTINLRPVTSLPVTAAYAQTETTPPIRGVSHLLIHPALLFVHPTL
eukprot:TRINITY_DN4000_c0_g1_i1.p1 TRINITY_DN4000_c0_g1~~TRINITY_DN4000_c0_g1_i1.p1  ORF type:complete len:109 (-),score=0.13 TRINITY_DN4000_c0_g1_i1:353-679(-)